MKRRSFLLASGVLGFWSMFRQPNSVASEIISPLGRHPFSAHDLIGRWYLREYSNENNELILMRFLSEKNINVSSLMAGVDSKTLSAEIHIACQKDYANDDVIYIDGWLLARTEARVSALLALRQVV